MDSMLPVFAQDNKPLYQQIYAQFAEDVRAGRLRAGERLPSKRRLAETLRVSVNTVDTAYQMLAAEGYVTAKPRSGFVVRKMETLRPAAYTAPSLAEPAPARKYAFNFETASIDTTLFPFKAWRRIQRDVLAGNPDLLNHGHRQGDPELREAIAKYLHEFRGAQCDASQIVVGAGIEYLLGLLARMAGGAVFAVENPGYARTHRILQNNGARVVFLPLDADGLRADALEQSGASLAYVTPSHQFPTGVTMPVGRRIELLQWAQRAPGRYLIEDDYDSEFRFDGRPLPSLQGLDDGAHVIYISTFSKSIAPAIRIGYMVLPPALLALYREEFGFYSSTVSRFEQQTLRQFITEGYFARHLARLRSAYRARRDALCTELTAAFPRGMLRMSGTHTGLHLLAQLQNGMTEQALVRAAEQADVHCSGLSAYYYANADTCPPATVVLGYAGMTEQALKQAVARLKEAWR